MKTMKRFNLKLASVGLGLMLGLGSCNNYLNVEPIDRLTGNNYYKSAEDVEANFAFIYSRFFDKINESWVMGAIGEARSGEIFISPLANNENSRKVIEVMGQNDLNQAISNPLFDWYNIDLITNWKTYYEVIQNTNILIQKLEEGIPGVSDSEKNRYIAEAKFMRNFTYFWMCRLYGDVVYYTQPYEAAALPREAMVSVINKCIEDLMPQKDLMPWSLNDPSLRGARPAKGAIIALLMHMNMWNSGFDHTNKQKYYEATIALGKELLASNQHKLIAPFTDQNWAIVTKGRSEESLFEFYKSINYGDNVNPLTPFWDHFLRWPYKFPRFTNQISHCYYLPSYMMRLFPEDVADKRREMWFEDIYSGNGNFVLRKYGTNVYASGNEDKNPDNSFLIFRYADAILLYAEACAETGSNDDEAIRAVNLIRTRAEATPYTGSGGAELKDFIFMERSRELFGESHHYFDLIRTRRILNPTWTMSPLSLDQFNRGGWTWPIDREALRYNPNMRLNDYWTTIGR